MKEKISLKRRNQGALASALIRLGALGLAALLSWQTVASERATPLCNGLSGLPKLNLSIESLHSCSDIDPETFEERTKEGYCKCQEEVFKLVTSGARPAELDRERAFSLASHNFNAGFESQIQFFNELGNFESLYSLEGGEQFSCHLGQEMKAVAESCSKAQALDGYLLKALGEFDAEALGQTKSDSGPLDRLYSVQTTHMNKLAQNKIFPCMSASEGPKLIFAMFELFFENSKEFLIANKEKFISAPTMTLTMAFGESMANNPEALNYTKAIGTHPLMKLLSARPETAQMIVDWIGKNPDSKLSEIFNPTSSPEISRAQTDYFQSRCSESLRPIRAGVKASVCGEDAFKFEEMNLTDFAYLAHPPVGADANSIMKAEAFAHLYCTQKPATAGDERFSISAPIDASDAAEDEGENMDTFTIEDSARVCQAFCVEGSAGEGECQLRPYEELAQQAQSAECQKSELSCFEIKAMVRVHEREQARRSFQLANTQNGVVPRSTFTRILLDQGVTNEVVTRASAPVSSSRGRSTQNNEETPLPAPLAQTPEAPRTKVSKATESAEDQAFQESLDALNAFTKKKQNEIELGPEALAEQARAQSKSPTSELVADIQARKRDEEIKKLRSAISDLEQMGGRTREDLKSLEAPPIPYRRNQQVGEDLGSGDFSELTPSPAYAQRPTNHFNSPYAQNFFPGPEREEPVVGPHSGASTPAAIASPVAGVTGASVPEAPAPAIEAVANSRAPASVGSASAATENAGESATVKLSYQASELDTLNPDQLEREGLGDKQEFLLEVVMSSGGVKVLIPVYKRVDNTGKAMWEPQMTSANRDYFERVLEIPLFKDFKRELLEKHFYQSASN